MTIELAAGNFAGNKPLHARFSFQGTELADLEVPPSAGDFHMLTLRVPPALSQSERMILDVESDVVEPDPATPQERRPLGIAISQV